MFININKKGTSSYIPFLQKTNRDGEIERRSDGAIQNWKVGREGDREVERYLDNERDMKSQRHLCVGARIYIYIYMQREREKEIKWGKDRDS